MVTNNPKTKAFFARIEGRVQGVGFRYSCMNEGQRQGLSGWVRNTSDGDVEVWAEGSEEKLDTFLQWLHKGPPHAKVISVQYEKREPTKQYHSFNVTY